MNRGKDPNIDICRAFARNVLQNSAQMEWSLQGLGMLRCYLSDDIRMHIWSDEEKVESVSELHTHPWDFDSLVIAGRIVNQRFMERTLPVRQTNPHMRQMIRCGEGGGLHGEPSEIYLEPQPPEIVTAGYSYSQAAAEIHQSRPDPGTISIITRKVPEGGHPDFANVYWPAGEQWVSAEPRPAVRTEVLRIVNQALAVMDREDSREVIS